MNPRPSGSRWLVVLSLLWSLLAAAPAAALEVQLSGPLSPGSAVLMRLVDFPPDALLSGTLDGEAFPIARNGMALLALDMHAKPGESTLELRITPPDGEAFTVTRLLPVPPRKYESEYLQLPREKVDLNPTDLSRSQRETERIRAALNRRGGEPGYLDGFYLPIRNGRLSGVFGSQRILNGKPRSPHNGADISAPRGTPLAATASGVVALVGKLYFFTGNTVILDHGDGVSSLYAHLDRVTVKEGDWVTGGTVIGTLGRTGRATGPHLHWGVTVRGARVDPLRLPGLEDQAAQLLLLGRVTEVDNAPRETLLDSSKGGGQPAAAAPVSQADAAGELPTVGDASESTREETPSSEEEQTPVLLTDLPTGAAGVKPAAKAGKVSATPAKGKGKVAKGGKNAPPAKGKAAAKGNSGAKGKAVAGPTKANGKKPVAPAKPVPTKKPANGKKSP